MTGLMGGKCHNDTKLIFILMNTGSDNFRIKEECFCLFSANFLHKPEPKIKYNRKVCITCVNFKDLED